MSEYKVPDEYYFRLHHVRPRFKGNPEDILFKVAEAVVRAGELPKKKFANTVDDLLFDYPGNANRTKKTMDNWRTEISALFGFVEHGDVTDRPGRRAMELAEKGDLVESFKKFLYSFQYPGAHIKPSNVLEQIEAGIHFKPAQYILSLLRYANQEDGNAVGITKPEVCHCIFNDLRVIRDNEGVELTWQRILDNRKKKVQYDCTSDVVRYAGDIIDYMEMANLLQNDGRGVYFLNTTEEHTIIKFCESTEWFDQYDGMISRGHATIDAVKACTNDWFSYMNRKMEDVNFSTDILAFIAHDDEEHDSLKANVEKDIATMIEDLSEHKDQSSEPVGTYMGSYSHTDIGDMGEALVYGHECMRVKLGNREDLIHLIKHIPTQFAAGYDVQSIELNMQKRYIEVKTTVSSKPLKFNRFRMTPNEWNTASSLHDRYFVYRLMISKEESKLFLLQDPVGLYKKDQIVMMLSSKGCADITFDPEKVGRFEELLTWKN